MSIKKREITEFLTDYATALSEGNLKSIAAAWHLPSLVTAKRGSLAVTTKKQVRDFFKQAIAAYQAEGITSVRLDSVDVIKISATSATASVVWRQVRADGNKGKKEHAYYLLGKHGLRGRLGIDVSVMVEE